MVLGEEAPGAEGSKVKGAQITRVTGNGFTIVRDCNVEAVRPCVWGTYRFAVRDGKGAESSVTVEFSDETAALIQHLRRTPLPPESLFWVNCAERSLATCLWETGQLPPCGRLVVEDLCLDELEVARRWDAA